MYEKILIIIFEILYLFIYNFSKIFYGIKKLKKLNLEEKKFPLFGLQEFSKL